jgi:hypothetical protein
MEKLAGSLSIFQTYLPVDRASAIIQLGDEAKKLAAIQRDAQVRILTDA